MKGEKKKGGTEGAERVDGKGHSKATSGKWIMELSASWGSQIALE